MTSSAMIWYSTYYDEMDISQEPYRRTCQKEALATVTTRYTEPDAIETNLSMCTGAGKTCVIVDVCHLPGVNRVLLVFPSLLLIQQFYRDHKASFTNMFYFATEGTLRSGAHVIRRISAAFIELAFDTITILTTYVSAPELLADLSEKRYLDMLIADEAHHITAPVYSAAYAMAAPFIRHTVNFSATLPDAKEPHYKYPLLKGIRDGVVRDFNIELFLCKSGEETGLLQMIDKLVGLHEGKAKILIYTAEANTDGSSVRTFMARYSAMVKARGWWIEGINADTLDKDRDPLLRAFEADKSPASILVSCRTLSEGIDLKNANCMLPWDPSASVKDNIQRIGRVVRLYKTMVGAVAKEQPPSTILIPVFVEEADYAACSGDRSAVHALLEKQISEGEKGNFRPIVNVCTALKSELAEEDSDLFNQLLDTYWKPKVRVDRDLVTCVAAQLKKPVEDVLEEVAAALTEKGELEEETIDAIREGDISQENAGAVATALAESQEIRLVIRDKDEEEVVDEGSKEVIVESKGSVYTASKKKKSDSAAAAARQRVAHRLRASFSDGCKMLLGLEAVDLDATEGLVLARLTTEVQYDEDWEKRRLEWVTLYEKLGKKKPSSESIDSKEKQIARWQSSQRRAYNKGKSMFNKYLYITDERIEILNKTEGWTWGQDDDWEIKRQNWITIYKKLGNKTPSHGAKDPEEKIIGMWQGYQRQSYKKQTLASDKIKKLEDTEGWEWESEDQWEPNRLKWINIYIKFGKNPSSHSDELDEKKSAYWQCSQRQNYRKKILSEEKIKILSATEGWLWEQPDYWTESYNNWVVIFAKLGNNRPSSTSKILEEKKAGEWQSIQRNAYNKKMMSADRITILEATEGWVWEEEDTWESNRLNWMIQYKKLNKKPSHSSKNPDEKRAGKWQCHQRENYRKKEAFMTLERISILESTDGWKWEEEDTFEPNRIHWLSQYQLLKREPSQSSKNMAEKRAATWRAHQRKDYKEKNACMTEERIAMLEATENWKWEEEDTFESNRIHWHSQYSLLKKNPSKDSKNIEEKRAAIWQRNTRKGYREQSACITTKRIAALNATPGWSWSADTLPVTPLVQEDDTIVHVNDDDVKGPERKRHISTGEAAPTGTPQERERSLLELLHKAYKTRNTDTYFSLMQTDPAKFEEYHAVADVHDARDPPERKPQNRIAEMLKKNNRASYKAVDLGCGRNALRTDERVSKMTWTSVDVVAADPTVTVADMGALPFEDESFDIAILNRSLWAKNHAVVLREVWRILKEGGRAILCESFQRWFSDGENELLATLKAAGFTVISEEGTTPDSSVSVFQYIEVRRD